MEDLIKKVYEEKLQNGSIEKIINDEIDKMVKSTCTSLFEWNGIIKKQMEEKIKDVMSNVIEKTDFSNYTQKLIYIINNTLPNTALADYSKIGELIENTCGKKALTYKDTVKLSNLFKMYCEYIENETFYESEFEHEIELDDEGDKTAYLDLNMEINPRTKNIKFYIDESDLDPYTQRYYSFEVRKNNSTISIYCDKKVSNLSSISKFEMFLIMLSNNSVKIDFDCENLRKEVVVNVEE